MRAHFRLSRPSFFLMGVLLGAAYVTPLIALNHALTTGSLRDVSFAAISLIFPVIGTAAMHAVNWFNQRNEKILAQSIKDKFAPHARKASQWYSSL